MNEPQPRQRAVALPRTCQPHAYWAGPSSEDPVLSTPAVWERRDAMAARFALVGDLEDGTLTADGDVHAWTLDDEPGEIGRFKPVRLMTHLQSALSLQRASALDSAAAFDVEVDLGVKKGRAKPAPLWMPASHEERQAIMQVRREWYDAELNRAAGLGRRHMMERAALRAELRAEGSTREMGALEQDLRAAEARIAVLAARQRAERDAARRLGADDLRASLRAAQEVLEAARISAPVISNRAQVDFDLVELSRWEGEGGSAAADTSGGLTDLESYGRVTPLDCETGTWIRWQCPSGHERSQFQGCKGLNCRVCADEATGQRANRGWEAVGRLAGSFGWHVLTVPPSLRRRVGDIGRRAFMQASWRAVQRWHDKMGFDVGGLVYIHPVGSKVMGCACGATSEASILAARVAGGLPPTHCHRCGAELQFVDGDTFHPHANIVTPLIGHDNKGRTDIIPRWRDDDELCALRECWRHELTTLTGLECPLPVVHYGYAGTVERARHAFRYFARSFPGWREWTSLKGGNAYGLLSNGIAMRFHLDVIRAGLRLAIELPQNPCPTCGRPQHMVSCSPGSPSTGPPEKNLAAAR